MKSESDAVLLDTGVFSYLLNESDKRAEIYKRHVQTFTTGHLRVPSLPQPRGTAHFVRGNQ